MTREEKAQEFARNCAEYNNLPIEVEHLLHTAFIVGYNKKEDEEKNPWHKVSEELPKTDILAMRKNARSPKVLKYYPSADRWFYDEYGYTEEGVREYYDYYMGIPEIKED